MSTFMANKGTIERDFSEAIISHLTGDVNGFSCPGGKKRV